MIPYPYNMVDMGGIDLAEANGTVVDGLYAKIVEAVDACGDVVLYNWKFASIEITPQHTAIILGSPLTINGVIQVTELDQVFIIGIGPEPPEPPDPPVLVSLSVTENGEYDPADYDADGFSIVTVNVESPAAAKRAIHIWTQSAGAFDASLNIQLGIYSEEFVPQGDVINIPYGQASSYINYGIVDISYQAKWLVRAVTIVTYNDTTYTPPSIVNQWMYSTSVDMLVVEV